MFAIHWHLAFLLKITGNLNVWILINTMTYIINTYYNMGTELINPNGPPMDPTKQYPEAMIYEAKKFTSIRVSEDTAARLRKYGVMGDSYNSLILKILARLNYLEGKERVK